MQINRQLIIILILASLLFSSLATAFYFFKKNQLALKSNNELVTIYVANNDIKKGTLLKAKHLGKTQIAKQYILNEPLTKSEILGKYTNETIYKHEIFLKQKLGKIQAKKGNELLEFKNNSYNMSFSLFENPNYSLNKGDTINIISVYGKGALDKKGKFRDFDVQYVVEKVKVLGFLRDGHIENKTITKQKVKKVIKKKVLEQELDIKSNELIVDIKTQTLLSLIKDYNKGSQLWMVKTKEARPIIKLIENTNKQKTKKAYKRTYPYNLYKGLKTSIVKSALINYENEKESIKKNINVTIDYKKICSSIKDKFIIGKVSSFYIRDKATTSSKRKKILYKNTIIPYILKQKDWYMTCDKQFVHKNVVNQISAKKVREKLGGK